MFRKNCFFVLAMGFFMLFYMPAWAADFCVDPGGGGTHTDLQSALTAAQSNSEDDTIKVVKGLYKDNFTYDTDKGYNLVLEGGYNSGCGCREVDPESTILQGTGLGPVLDIQDTKGGSFTVDGFTLTNGGGTQVYYGGGIWARSLATSGLAAGDITIRNNIIEKNAALTSGGGIYAESTNTSSSYNAGNITLVNNIITGNKANTHYGGGVFAELYANASIGTMTLLNNTIHGNKAGHYGGGTYLYTLGSGDSGIINVFNNIITGNEDSYGGADITLSMHSGDKSYGYNNNYHSLYGSWTASGSNIDSDPLFVSEGSWDENGTPADITDDVWTKGNYHLKGNSPCIDAGDNSANELPASDFEGDDRIIDGNKDGNAVVDMGADEYKRVNAMPSIPLLLLN